MRAVHCVAVGMLALAGCQKAANPVAPGPASEPPAREARQPVSELTLAITGMN